jgi:hypothetical protein
MISDKLQVPGGFLCEIIFVLSSIYFDMYWMYRLSNKTYESHRYLYPLDDIIHQKFLLKQFFSNNQIQLLKKIKDVLCIVPLMIALCMCEFNYVWGYTKLYALSHYIRPMFYLSTIIPRCSSRKMIYDITHCMIGGNHDLIFSGHFVGVLLSCHAMYKYFKVIGLVYLAHTWWMYAIFMFTFIITLREHYTIDLLVSISITINLICLHDGGQNY